MNRYPLKLENLRNDTTKSEVREFLDGPPTDLLENVEIFSYGTTTTACLVLTRPDVAYEFLNYEEPNIGGNRVTFRPELFEEMSLTLNGSWLREIEDENPNIQVEIKKIANMFNLKLILKKSVHGGTETISFTGVPWRIEQVRASLIDKLQDIIMKRSENVQTNKSPSHPDTAGNQYAQSRNVVILSEHGKPALKSDDRQSSVDLDPNSGVEAKLSTEADSTNPSKKRVRALVKPIDTETEASAGVGSIISDNDVMKDQPIKRNRVLVSKPEDMQKSDSPVDASGLSTPVDYPVSTLYKRIIRVEMDIHRYLLEHSKCLDFTDSSVTQFQVSDEYIDWVIGDNNEKDLRHNEECLRGIIDGLHTKCYYAPDEFDFEIFKDAIKADNNNKEITLIFDAKERKCKIVGQPSDVKNTYKWISSMSGELSERCRQKPGKGPASAVIGESKTYVGGSSAQQLDAQQGGSPRYCQDYKPQNWDIGNNKGRFPNPKEKVTKAGDGIHISKKSSKDRLEFTTRGNLRVSVYQGNMIKQSTEAIVNPANEYLAHAGGLARVILDAGGPVIDVESRDIISKRGKVQTSEVVHTSAGNLPPPIRYVIHAVGPTAHEFKDNKAGLVPTLKVTFRNCLEYANDKLRVSSISLPPISSGIFAVPMPDIIQGAVEAIQDFDQKNPSAVLKEVHFISNDAKATGEMISCFRKVIG